MSLTRSLITDQHRPILGQPPANGFATGNAGSHLANAIARTTAEKAQETRLEYALEIEIRGQHDDVANCHAARPRQHEHNHASHFAGFKETSRLPGLLQLLRRPVREQCADDGSRRDRAHANAVLENLASHRLDKAVDRPLGRRLDRLPWRRKMGGQGARDDDVARSALNHVRQHVVHILLTTLTFKFSIRRR
jgi:hypothetical protein